MSNDIPKPCYSCSHKDCLGPCGALLSLIEVMTELDNIPEPLDCFDYFEITDWKNELKGKIM